MTQSFSIPILYSEGNNHEGTIMKKIMTAVATLGLATCLSAPSNAAGFFIQEQSVSGLGASFAGQTAMPRDASIIYFNPAGMTYLEGSNGNIGVHVIAPYADIDDTGSTAPGARPLGGDSDNPYDPTPVPNLHYSHQLNDKLWAGVAVTAPFGLGNEYDDGWFGRFDSLKSELKTINVQPSVAYKVNDRLSIGGGIDVQYADAELTSTVFVGAGNEGVSTLEGDDISYGYNLGMMYDVTDQTRIGLAYRSQVNHKLDGDVSLAGTGVADTTSGGAANLNLPEMVNFGITHQLDDKTTLLGGVTWFGWSNFERITAIRDDGTTASDVAQNYKNTFAYSLGAEYDYSDEWTFRGGVQYDETPTQDGFRSTRTPDGDRIWLSGGATYNVTDRLSWDFALTYINVSEEDIDLTRAQPGAGGTSVIDAKSSADIAIGAIGLNYKF